MCVYFIYCQQEEFVKILFLLAARCNTFSRERRKNCFDKYAHSPFSPMNYSKIEKFFFLHFLKKIFPRKSLTNFALSVICWEQTQVTKSHCTRLENFWIKRRYSFEWPLFLDFPELSKAKWNITSTQRDVPKCLILFYGSQFTRTNFVVQILRAGLHKFVE